MENYTVRLAADGSYEDETLVEKSVTQYSTHDTTKGLAELLMNEDEEYARERAFLAAEIDILEDGLFKETVNNETRKTR